MTLDQQREAINNFRKYHGITYEQLGQYMKQRFNNQPLSKQHVQMILAGDRFCRFDKYKDQFISAFNKIFKERGFNIHMSESDIYRLVEDRQSTEPMQVNS